MRRCLLAGATVLIGRPRRMLRNGSFCCFCGEGEGEGEGGSGMASLSALLTGPGPRWLRRRCLRAWVSRNMLHRMSLRSSLIRWLS